MDVKIKTLTPLWTGGVSGKVDRLHETGILGSLRWWYEAIVRGLGGKACDPSQGKCCFDADKYKKSEATDERQRLRDAGLCDVCQVFGATGWRRRFRLEVIPDNINSPQMLPESALNIRPPNRQRGWFLPSGLGGQVTMRFTGDNQVLALMVALLRFLERWGTIGAKPQLGYGVFEIQSIDGQPQVQWEWKELGNEEPHSSLPDLRRFGFFNYCFTAQKGWWTHVPGIERLLGSGDTARTLQGLVQKGMVPVMPALKNKWRFEHWNGAIRVGQFLFGTTEKRRIRSKLSVSWAYSAGNSWKVRGWVWLPERDKNDDSQNIHIDPQSLQRVWQGVRNEELWRTTLHVANGTLTCIPNATWEPWTVQKVLDFLNIADDRTTNCAPLPRYS